MEEQAIDKAYKSLCMAIQELQNNMNGLHEAYRIQYIQIIDLLNHLQLALLEVQTVRKSLT